MDQKDIRFRGYDQTYTHEEIGIHLGISAEQVRKIERRALIKLLYKHGRFLKDLLDESLTP
jgi:DNA-directed RNA polymerase sigma subunit (sigma70/sigma32)